MNLIEQLKDPEQAQPFGLLKRFFPGKARIIESAFPNGCLIHSARGDFFEMRAIVREPSLNCTYILKPGYQPEPEYVDYLIEICEDAKCEEGNFLGVKEKLDNSPILPHEHTYLYCLSSIPEFFCFWQEENNEGYRITQHINKETVATAIDGGNKVYARLRKGKRQ